MNKDEVKKLFDSFDQESKWDTNWLRYFRYACRYRKNHGNLLIPERFCLEDKGNLIQLGKWIQYQRRMYYKDRLSMEKIQLLELLDMKWDANEARWEDYFACAKAYFEEHGNLLVPADYLAKRNNDSKCLGTWIQTQRRINKSGYLSEDKKERLMAIGMVWENKLERNKAHQLIKKQNEA